MSSEFLANVRLRPAVPGDLKFVVKSWVRSFANSDWAGPMSRERLVRAIKGTIADLIARGAEVWVACLAEHTDFIFGFVCFERDWQWPLVHFVYVRDDYRDNGIGKVLVGHATDNRENDARYTFKTRYTRRVLPQGRYAPALARYPQRKDRDEGLPSDADAQH